MMNFIDFGVAQHIGKRGSKSIRGTLLYMAPEILSSHPYDNRVDLWSIGVILYGKRQGHFPASQKYADLLH
jgi:serine/threonine protein kinase